MFEWVRRVGMAIVEGARYGVNVYRREALVPTAPAVLSMTASDWDSFAYRLARYWHHDLYYYNEAFTKLEQYRLQHLRENGLYRFTRGIYNPVFRLVNITAAKCYGGNIDWKTLESGAIPLMDASEAHKEAVRQMLKWSNFGQMKMLYARRLARYGDGVLKIVDDREKGRVRLESLHPGVVRDAEFDAVGYVQAYTIEYAVPDPADPDTLVLYREVVDKETFRTYIIRDNGEPQLYGWHTDVNGRPQPQWDNEYGFVPLVIAKAADVGRTWGATTFHGGLLSKLDQANDLASRTNDQIRKLVDALHFFEGAQSLKQIEAGTTSTDPDDQSEREEIRVLVGPAGVKPHILAANLDFEGALKALDGMLNEIELDAPELAFAKLREYQLHSNPAVMTALGDAIERLTEFNGNADHGLLRAFQMGISMGALGNYEGFEPFGLDAYDRGRLDFQLRERDIVADSLTLKERIDVLDSSDAPPRWIWRLLDVDAAEIARAEADQLAQERTVAADVARTLAAGLADQDGAGDGEEA